LALDLGQQQFLPALGAVDVASAQFRRQAVACAVEQQQGLNRRYLTWFVLLTRLLSCPANPGRYRTATRNRHGGRRYGKTDASERPESEPDNLRRA
jgi:hypothetical protein